MEESDNRECESLRKLFMKLKEMLKIFLDNDIFVYSGNACLYILTAAFPFLMLIIAIVNIIPFFTTEDVLNLIFKVLPDLSIIRESFRSIISNLKNESSGFLASLAAVGTLWSASGGITAIQKGLIRITPGAEKRSYDKIISIVFTLLFIIAIPALIFFGLLGSSFINFIRTMTEHLGLEVVMDTFVSVMKISNMVSSISMAFLFLLTYTYLPGGKRKMRNQVPGAIISAILCFLFSYLFSKFIPIFWNSSSIYGSLASVFLIILWLRVIVIIIFTGAIYNAVDSEHQSVLESL